MADDAAPRHDATQTRREPLSTGALRRGGARNPGVLVRRPSHPGGILDCGWRETGGGGGAFLQRGSRDQWRGRRGTVQKRIGLLKTAALDCWVLGSNGTEH